MDERFLGLKKTLAAFRSLISGKPLTAGAVFAVVIFLIVLLLLLMRDRNGAAAPTTANTPTMAAAQQAVATGTRNAGHLRDAASDNRRSGLRRNGNGRCDCVPHRDGHAYPNGDSDGQPAANADADRDSDADADCHINPDADSDRNTAPDRYGGVCADQRLSLGH